MRYLYGFCAPHNNRAGTTFRSHLVKGFLAAADESPASPLIPYTIHTRNACNNNLFKQTCYVGKAAGSRERRGSLSHDGRRVLVGAGLEERRDDALVAVDGGGHERSESEPVLGLQVRLEVHQLLAHVPTTLSGCRVQRGALARRLEGNVQSSVVTDNFVKLGVLVIQNGLDESPVDLGHLQLVVGHLR